MHASLAPVLWSLLLGANLPADYALPAAPGRFVRSQSAPPASARKFPSGQPVIATTYFYWYDADTKAHVVDYDGTDALTEHPPTLKGFSYKNVAWHKQQLADMTAAGIDVAMPVYWGAPDGSEGWSDAGLPKLIAARKQLLAAGKSPPAIGLFYDTSTLQYNRSGHHVDLTTPAGQRWFYGTIRNFFSLIPAEHRAYVDGKPIVFLYGPSFAAKVDESLFPEVRRMFREDFGSDIYLVKTRGWPGTADSEYEWGAALDARILETAAIGPGYDHSAVPGRTPLVRKRDDGRFYRFSWGRLLSRDPKSRPWLVHLETWNEFHEGTEICETAEFGRKYIELTRQMADEFHGRKQIDMQSWFSLPEATTSPEKGVGLEILDQRDGDGPIVTGRVGGRTAWTTAPNKFVPQTRYMYFDVDYAFLVDGDETLEATVEFYDSGPQSFHIEYDSSDPALSGLEQSFRPTEPKLLAGRKEWKQAVFTLPHARFSGRVNGGDFRLSCRDGELSVSRVTIRRANRR
ncbi:MAG: DUF5010 domain-containing protein [Planctomycetaceae bacterium]